MPRGRARTERVAYFGSDGIWGSGGRNKDRTDARWAEAPDYLPYLRLNYACVAGHYSVVLGSRMEGNGRVRWPVSMHTHTAGMNDDECDMIYMYI